MTDPTLIQAELLIGGLHTALIDITLAAVAARKNSPALNSAYAKAKEALEGAESCGLRRVDGKTVFPWTTKEEGSDPTGSSQSAATPAEPSSPSSDPSGDTSPRAPEMESRWGVPAKPQPAKSHPARFGVIPQDKTDQ